MQQTPLEPAQPDSSTNIPQNDSNTRARIEHQKCVIGLFLTTLPRHRRPFILYNMREEVVSAPDTPICKMPPSTKPRLKSATGLRKKLADRLNTLASNQVGVAILLGLSLLGPLMVTELGTSAFTHGQSIASAALGLSITGCACVGALTALRYRNLTTQRKAHQKESENATGESPYFTLLAIDELLAEFAAA